MNVRFAETCREAPLQLDTFESNVATASTIDGRTNRQRQLNCEADIFLGVFFDGTNNNKYRDTPGFSHSNVARLYEAYPGTPAAQRAPVFKPRVNPDGSTTPRPVFPDKPFKASSVPPEDCPRYRKVYVPGLGTAFPDVGDDGTGLQKTGGLALALLGQVRIDWALLQLQNQVHAAVFREPLEPFIDMQRLLLRRQRPRGQVRSSSTLLRMNLDTADALQAQLQQRWDAFERLIGHYDRESFDALLAEHERRLAAALARRGGALPRLRKLRLSVFGFSRGAAAARSWVQHVRRQWGGTVAGLPLQIDFLGLFDTVASVGLAQSTPYFHGHAGWAGDAWMPVAPEVKRCVHLVAALEVRGSFPLDSVCQHGVLPPNCKEIAYPGVHSDVGGGYPPDDQGRALGIGAEGDRFKLSQISLAQMYREARMAGVPLAPAHAMDTDKARNFAIAPQLRDDFNAYIDATRSGSVTPTRGTGEARFAALFPSETQPREELHRVIRRHAGYLLRWRKALLDEPGGIAALPGLSASRSESRHQDTEDFRGAEAELRREIAFLQSTDARKFHVLDDPFFDNVFSKARTAGAASLGGGPASSTAFGLNAFLALWELKKGFSDLLRDKQHQWDSWLSAEWQRSDPAALPAAARRLFEHHVHDSRAWFKPFTRSDGRGWVPDDETWFVFGGRDQERRRRLAELAGQVAHDKALGPSAGQAGTGSPTENEQSLAQMQQEGQPLLIGGREPYRMWGYVRHRRLYQTGREVDPAFTARQSTLDREEQARDALARRERRIAEAQARHAARVEALDRAARELLSRPQRTAASTGPGPWRLSPADEQQYIGNQRAQRQRADADLADELAHIDRQNPAPRPTLEETS